MSTQTNVRLVPCPRCGEGMRAGMTKTVIWIEERLFLLEDVPAQVCDWCVEQFYDDSTTDAIRRLSEEGFLPAEVKREVLVPVLSLTARIRQYNPTYGEPQPAFAEVDA